MTILFWIFATTCKSQIKRTEYSIQEFEFESILGNKIGGNKDDVYCLLGQEFFVSSLSDNSAELLKNWLAEHPNAKLIPVSVIKSEFDITYCWIVDGTEILNLYMIKKGYYLGRTMQRPRTWTEMSRKEKKIYRGIEKPNVELLIPYILYDKFLEELKFAELYAKENKLGVWEKK